MNDQVPNNSEKPEVTLGPVLGLTICFYYLVLIFVAAWQASEVYINASDNSIAIDSIVFSMLVSISFGALFYVRRVYKTLFNGPTDADWSIRIASAIYFVFRPLFAAAAAITFMIALRAHLLLKTADHTLSDGVFLEAFAVGLIAGVSAGQAVELLANSASQGIKRMKVFSDANT